MILLPSYPEKDKVLVHHSLATLDVLSGGRLVVGIGAGWLKAEFDAVVTTPFAERGAVTDEYIDAFRVLWGAHDVHVFRKGLKRLRHPVVGELELEHETMLLPDDSGLQVAMYSAPPGSASNAYHALR